MALSLDRHAVFLEQHPGVRQPAALDALRTAEYGRLDAQRHVYLDYTGGSLYAASQVQDHMARLGRDVLGNPHSASLCSATTTRLVEQARRAVLSYFHAPPEEYTAVFTLNASGALKAVGEAYPFAPDGRYLLTVDNHNSVNGIREFARAGGAAIEYAGLTVPELRIDRGHLEERLAAANRGALNLFAFPAQSNFSGVKHPLELVERARAAGTCCSTRRRSCRLRPALDLGEVQADFVSVSFYKMFGYPTGVGGLIARHAALAKLRRPWFAGGTVNFATVQGQKHILSPHEGGFEDGTLNYLSLSRPSKSGCGISSASASR